MELVSSWCSNVFCLPLLAVVLCETPCCCSRGKFLAHTHSSAKFSCFLIHWYLFLLCYCLWYLCLWYLIPQIFICFHDLRFDYFPVILNHISVVFFLHLRALCVPGPFLFLKLEKVNLKRVLLVRVTHIRTELKSSRFADPRFDKFQLFFPLTRSKLLWSFLFKQNKLMPVVH